MDKDKNNNTQHRKHRHHHRHHHKRFWRWFWLVIGILIVAGALFAGYVYKNLRDTTDNMYTPVSKSTKSNKGRSLDKLLAEKKPINILLLGTDTGEMGRKYKGRTDAIMILSVNPEKKTTSIISIPRDMKASLPDYPDASPIKINSAYTLGGVSETIKTLDKYYSVPIDGYILVNMRGLVKSIDQVGGVDVKSPLTFTNMGYSFVKGKTYHMSGKKALAFVDMRHEDPNNDYGRQERDRLVIAALLQKSISPNTLLNTKFLNSISDSMQTDLTLKQMMKIATDYRQASETTTSDHAQGVSKMINNSKYGQMEVEVVGKKERQRISDEIRQSLELNKINVMDDGEY